jgi:uncharacterized membrane protein
MDVEVNKSIDINTIPANRQLVNELWSRGLISSEAKNYALNILYPTRKWSIWIALVLQILGVSLILCGLVYFFAFNWAKMGSAIKFCLIEAAIFSSLAITYIYGLNSLAGKIALLSACVLVGLFLAVFGQVYQTGADSYKLFMMWAICILPWVLIADFAPLWLIWLIVSNIFLVLFWFQGWLHIQYSSILIFSYLVLFNLPFLGLREVLVCRGKKWLQDSWTRQVLIFFILFYTLIPNLALIFAIVRITNIDLFSAILSVIIYPLFFFIYCYKLPDMWALAKLTICFCIVIDAVILKLLEESLGRDSLTSFFLMGLNTLALTILAVVALRFISKKIETRNV